MPGVELWHWLVARRPDRSARMHAKIAVADRRVLLGSSANLTQSGFDTNIEAGLLVHGGWLRSGLPSTSIASLPMVSWSDSKWDPGDHDAG